MEEYPFTQLLPALPKPLLDIAELFSRPHPINPVQTHLKFSPRLTKERMSLLQC